MRTDHKTNGNERVNREGPDINPDIEKFAARAGLPASAIADAETNLELGDMETLVRFIMGPRNIESFGDSGVATLTGFLYLMRDEQWLCMALLDFLNRALKQNPHLLKKAGIPAVRVSDYSIKDQ